MDPGALQGLQMLTSPDGMSLLMRTLEFGTVRQQNADTLNKSIKESFNTLKLRAARSGQDLLFIQQAGSDMAARLSTLEALVQQAGTLGDFNASSGATDAKDRMSKLTELRARLNGLAVTQNDEILKFANPSGVREPSQANPYLGGTTN